jgi:hypothetical protein
MTLYIIVIASAIVVTLVALIPTILDKDSEF